MHKIKTYMDKIIENGKHEDMEQIEEYFYKLMCKVHMVDPDMTKWIKEDLKEMAYGKVITEEMAHEWVYSMKPCGQYWTMEETNNAMKSLGYNLDPIHFYIVANMQFNDQHNLVKDNEELALKMAYNWLKDTDAVKDKLYEYYKHIIAK